MYHIYYIILYYASNFDNNISACALCSTVYDN